MHGANRSFWKYVSEKFNNFFNKDIIEFGSYNINGTIRDYFLNCKSYIGVDWRKGPCVDMVALSHRVKVKNKCKAVLSASMLEHDPYWKKSLLNMIDIMHNDGIMVLTWGSAKNPSHCLAEAPDGKFHSLKVEEVTNFLIKNGLCIHTSIYDGDLQNIIDNFIVGRGTFGSVNGKGEHNLIAFKNKKYLLEYNNGYFSNLFEEDKI